MKRETFKAGAKRPNRNDPVANDMFGGERADRIKDRFDKKVDDVKDEKLKTLFVRDVDKDTLEKIKDIVYTEKTENDPFSNQSKIVNRALEDFINNYPGKIKHRPKWLKEQEAKKSRK